MKSFRALLLIVFSTFSIFTYAQDSLKSSYTSHAYFPKKGDIGTTLLLSGLIDNIQLQSQNAPLGENILFARYYLEDDLVLRLGFGLNLTNYKREQADSVGQTLVSTDSLNRRYTLNISGGIEKHLESSNRLDPYLFGQLNLTFVGKRNTEINTSTESAAGTSTTERIIKQDGGFGLGLVAGGGLNYFVAKRFSIGTELGLVFQYSRIGGTTSDNFISTPVNGNSTSDFNTSDDTVIQTSVDISTNAMFNISYFF